MSGQTNLNFGWPSSNILILSVAIILLTNIFPTECSQKVTKFPPATTTSPSNSTSGVTPLNGNCTNSHSCGQNTFCNLRSQCACDLGFIPTGDGFNCKKFHCSTTSQCNSRFGQGVKCWNYDTCFCDQSFAIDTRSQICLPIKSPLNSYCTSDAQCGANTFCNNRKCTCDFDNSPSLYNTINCDQDQCQIDSQCTQKYGIHSQCQFQTCQCNTNSGWGLDTKTQKCTPNYLLLNSTCSSFGQCGPLFATCGANKCRCTLGATPDPIGQINCNQFKCNQDLDCISKFGPNLKCNFNMCYCNADMGFIVAANQTCVPRSVYLGGGCTSTAQCGIGANCINQKCHCQFAFSPMTNGMDCQMATCSVNSDCTRLDPNSQCTGSSCFCSSGYVIDFVSQKCRKDDMLIDTYLEVVGTVFLIALVGGAVVAGLVILTRKRRQSGYIQKS